MKHSIKSVLLLVVCLCSVSTKGATVSLTWTNLDVYDSVRIFTVGTVGAVTNYTLRKEVAGTATNATVGATTFCLRAVRGGVESDDSNWTPVHVRPRAPAIMRVH